jgi:hypothetical protein
MRLIALISILFLFATKGFCSEYTNFFDTTKHKRSNQFIPAEFRKAEKAHKHYYDDCAFVNKYSLSQRLKKYPFSKAAKIVAVSYRWDSPKADIVLINDSTHGDSSHKTVDTAFEAGLHVNKGVLNHSSLKETKILNQSQINRLTNIIYNTDFKVHDVFNTSKEGACFNPRNALLFYDRNGKIFDYMEICFECLGSYSKSDRFTVGTQCSQKYELLRKFFMSLGVKYGTITK